MNNNRNYPTHYDLVQSLSEFCQTRFVSEFAKRKGIFITNATREEQADFLSGLFFEHAELELIRNAALGIHTKTTLSGFWLATPDGEKYDLMNALENYTNEIVEPKNNMRLGPITETAAQNYKGNVSYQQKQPGRLEFLQGTPRSFDFYVNDVGNGKWTILIDGERSSDAKLMMDWLEKKIPRTTQLIIIDQDILTTRQTIDFFDQLAIRAVSKEWRFSQVKRIVIRKESEPENDDNDENEDVIDAQSSVLTGISQAILDGKNLRGNSFVKQCEDGGYRFTAMSYEYEHQDHPYVMEVRAEFKGRPKVFEVAMEGFYQRTGLNEQLELTSLPPSEKINMLSKFYSEAKYLFDDLTFRKVPIKEP